MGTRLFSENEGIAVVVDGVACGNTFGVLVVGEGGGNIEAVDDEEAHFLEWGGSRG